MHSRAVALSPAKLKADCVYLEDYVSPSYFALSENVFLSLMYSTVCRYVPLEMLIH